MLIIIRIFVLAFVFFSMPTLAQEAYILIDAVKLPLDSKQPTWIALKDRIERRLVHLPVGELLIPVDAGEFTISHIDFQNSKYLGFGTMHIEKHLPLKVDATAGTITYIGLLKLEKGHYTGGERPYKLSLHFDDEMIGRACYDHSEVFDRLPLRVIKEDGSEKLVKIRCKTPENE